MKEFITFWLIWLLLLSWHKTSQSKIDSFEDTPNVNISQICPPLVPSPENENHIRVRYKTAVLPLADNRAVVLPCQLKLEKPTTGSKINYFPDQSIMIHYINATAEADSYSEDEFWACRDFITLKPDINLDTMACNLPESNQRLIQYVFWSEEEGAVQLHLHNYNISSGNENYLQIYMTILSDNSHECRVQQYDLAPSSPTSCQSNDYKLGRFCAEFDCSLFHKGRFQSLLHTTHTTVKLLKVSREEIIRVIVATICPILIVCLLILLTCVLVSCCRVSDTTVETSREEETTKTSLECH